MDFSKIFNDLIAYAWETPRAVFLSILLIITYLYMRDNGKNGIEKIKSVCKNHWFVLFFFYLALILIGTVFARQHTVPFKRIFENFGFTDDANWNKEIIENILLFIPYSFLYLQTFENKRSFKYMLRQIISTSVFIETCQLLMWVGNFQIADIIHNTIGGLIGYVIWCLVHVCLK